MKELSKEAIEKNKEAFLTLLEKAVNNRPNANWEALKNKLENSDFFIAPASVKYHSCFKGGLCLHSLLVYDNMINLVKAKGYENIISEDSITIVALLHDISKMNTFTTSVKNKKVYSENGSKYDEMGNFDWVAEKSYARKPDEELFFYGNHEETSEFMIRTFIPLSYEESIAVLNHMGGTGYDSCQGYIAQRNMSRYPMVTFLHIADTLATYVDENVNFNE